jgi:hypothetical protein
LRRSWEPILKFYEARPILQEAEMSTKLVARYSAEQWDTLSAIWVMSCNDKFPIMTYAGLGSRVTLAEVRKLVGGRRELFRPMGERERERHMKTWKADIISDMESSTEDHTPRWILDILDPEERRRAMEEFHTRDAFINQFRQAPYGVKCKRSAIDWGLNHIERLRRAELEEIELLRKARLEEKVQRTEIPEIEL